MQKSGRRVDPQDYPPELEWEAPIWDLYMRLQTQRRDSGALDYSPAIALIDRRGWDVETALDLLQVIEKTFMKSAGDE